MSNPNREVETRVAISLAIGRYLRAADRFVAASKEFNESCSALRNQLVEPVRFVTQVDYKHYLITSDQDRNFEVEELDLL